MRATFSELLAKCREAAGLTREELAKASGMSVRALRDLENGRALAPQQRSAEVLAETLGLTGEDRTEFLSTAQERRRRSPRPATVAATPVPMSAGLPPALPDLLGREDEVARLRAAVADGGTVAVVGQPGVGKTVLAVSVAHELRSRFPDGCLWVDLRGMDDQPLVSRAALERLLRGLGVSASLVPGVEADQVSLYRSVLTGRRVLVVLDNAADEAQVRPLLATAPGCVTLVTCRRALAGLEGARWEWLGPLAAADAVELLATIAGADAVRAEPEPAAELVRLCGNLPLAVRIAGNRLATRPQWSVAYLVRLLRDEHTRLSSLSVGDLQVRSAFELSYRRLAPGARVVFRRLAAVPGADFGVALAEVATGLTASETLVYLDELADASLLRAAGTELRFQFHDLMRLFAVERWEAEETPADRDRVFCAVHEHLLRTASATGRMFFPDGTPVDGFPSRDEANEWLVREESNWIAAQRVAARHGWHSEVRDLAEAMHWYSDSNWLGLPWDQIFSLGVDAARALGDRPAEAKLLNFTGWAQDACLRDYEAALATHRKALAIAVEAGHRLEEAWACAYLGTMLRRFGQPEEGLELTRRAAELAEEFDFLTVRLPIQNRLGFALQAVGRHSEALSVHRALLADIDRRQADESHKTRRLQAAFVKWGIGNCLVAMGDWQLAAETYREMRQVYADADSPANMVESILNEGEAWVAAGEHTRARECLEQFLGACGYAVPPVWQERARELRARLGAD